MNIFKKIWYSERFMTEDQKIVNTTLRDVTEWIEKEKTPPDLDSFCVKTKTIDKRLLQDIIRAHSKYLRVENGILRPTYYGIQFNKKGGFCIGYYVKHVLTLKFIFQQTKYLVA